MKWKNPVAIITRGRENRKSQRRTKNTSRRATLNLRKNELEKPSINLGATRLLRSTAERIIAKRKRRRNIKRKAFL